MIFAFSICSRREAALFQVGVPDHHLVERNAHLVAGPAAEVLVGEEQHLLALGEGPVEDLRRVGRGADDAAVGAAEGLEVGGGIDVGDRRHLLVGIEHGGQFAPGALDLGQAGHVGHRTAGGEVGQDRNLLGRDRMSATSAMKCTPQKTMCFGFRLRGQARELERIAGDVGVGIDVGALVVVAEQDTSLPSLALAARMRSPASLSARLLKRSKEMVAVCMMDLSSGSRAGRHGASRPCGCAGRWRPCCPRSLRECCSSRGSRPR
jgi:hypothetical protein